VFLGSKFETYLLDPTAHPNLGDHLLELSQECVLVRQQLHAAERAMRYKHRQKAVEKEGGLLQVGEAYLRRRDWSQAVYGTPGPITAEDMKTIAQSIILSGWISIDVVRALGYRDRKKQTGELLLRQITTALPIAAITRSHSRYKYLVDSVNWSLEFVNSALHPQELTRTQAAAKMEVVIEETAQALAEDAACWKEMSDAEFDDEEFMKVHCNRQAEVVNDPRKSKVLQRYPSLRDALDLLLTRFGEEAAQSRRRDDKTHTIGVSCRKLRELLHNEFSIDVSHASIFRMYSTARVTDARKVRDGGRYGILDVTTTQVKNNQFVTPHVRGRWCAAKNRNLKELATDLTRRGIKAVYASLDNLARTPVVIDAASHMYARNRGHTKKGDGHDNYDHTTVVGPRMLMEVTGACQLCTYS
jgi:hypothetical protein